MPNLTQKKISEAKRRLRRADAPTTSLFAASCSLASIIAACELMIGIIQEQQKRIEDLELERRESEYFAQLGQKGQS